MNIEIEKLSKLVADADKIFIEPEGEEVLIQLLEIQKQVEDAIDQAKEILKETALKTNPNFRSIRADRVKVYFRQFGPKYRIDESHVQDLPKELYEIETKVKAKPKAIESWVEEHKGLPLGIIEPEREKKISFSMKGDSSDESE